MPVWFAYRSFDMGPTGKYLKRFEDDSVLDWFRQHWDHLAVADRDVADARLDEIVGCDGWFLWNPFRVGAEGGLAPPQTHEELMDLLRGYVPEVRSGSAHDLQVFTEEDGEGGALYYFDGHFLKESGPLAAYLLHEDWKLPSGHGDGGFVPAVETEVLTPGGDGPGTTYLALLTRDSKYPLDDLPVGDRIEGVRVPDLARHLCARFPFPKGWTGYLQRFTPLLLAGVEAADPLESALLRAIQSAPGDAVSWAAWADLRQEQGREPPGVGLLREAFARLGRLPGQLHLQCPGEGDLNTACRGLLELEEKHRGELRTSPRSLIHVEPHLAQVCLDVSWSEEPRFDQWIIFDDLWASAHPDLANAILRFARRWDVLTAD